MTDNNGIQSVFFLVGNLLQIIIDIASYFHLCYTTGLKLVLEALIDLEHVARSV